MTHESDMGADVLPIAIESGEEEERDLDFLPEDTIIASVLASLRLGLFTVISTLLFGEEIRDSMRGRKFLELSVIGV